jgi:hypothetical protein
MVSLNGSSGDEAPHIVARGEASYPNGTYHVGTSFAAPAVSALITDLKPKYDIMSGNPMEIIGAPTLPLRGHQNPIQPHRRQWRKPYHPIRQVNVFDKRPGGPYIYCGLACTYSTTANVIIRQVWAAFP